ncbi:MAG: hypothetical protein ACJAXI_003311 [Crocinitomicaceae bacterium]|jgi:hypothetical protein
MKKLIFIYFVLISSLSSAQQLESSSDWSIRREMAYHLVKHLNYEAVEMSFKIDGVSADLNALSQMETLLFDQKVFGYTIDNQVDTFIILVLIDGLSLEILKFELEQLFDDIVFLGSQPYIF